MSKSFYYFTDTSGSPFSRGNKYQLMTKSRLRDGTEPAVRSPKLLSNVTYLLTRLLSDNSWVLALVSDWIKRFGNSSSASTKICQNQYLFPRLNNEGKHHLRMSLIISEIFQAFSQGHQWGIYVPGFFESVSLAVGFGITLRARQIHEWKSAENQDMFL